jgi:hypothetical protein
MYTPEEWCLIKINQKTTFYKIFGSWRGGYLSGDSWRINSGITSVTLEGDYYYFSGASGSVYKCHKDCYGIRSPYNSGVLLNYKEQAGDMMHIYEHMPENILEMDWNLDDE